MLLAALSTGWAVIVSVAFTGIGTAGAFVKLRPERDALVAQAAEQVTAAMATTFAELRRQLKESRWEVERLKRREDELLRRIGALEEKAHRELAELREEKRVLQARVAELENSCTCLRRA